MSPFGRLTHAASQLGCRFWKIYAQRLLRVHQPGIESPPEIFPAPPPKGKFPEVSGIDFPLPAEKHPG